MILLINIKAKYGLKICYEKHLLSLYVYNENINKYIVSYIDSLYKHTRYINISGNCVTKKGK